MCLYSCLLCAGDDAGVDDDGDGGGWNVLHGEERVTRWVVSLGFPFGNVSKIARKFHAHFVCPNSVVPQAEITA